jgi:hypothetical protein
MDNKPCLVCDDPSPTYDWTDYHGEGYCLRCGTPYQLKRGELGNGETYPRCNILAEFIPVFRRFWAEKKVLNGQGLFLGTPDSRRYPGMAEGGLAFDIWFAEHADEYPTLVKEKTE